MAQGDQYVNWVSDLLPDDLPSSSHGDNRIFFYNFDSYWKRDAVNTRLFNLGNGLLEHTLRAYVDPRRCVSI